MRHVYIVALTSLFMTLTAAQGPAAAEGGSPPLTNWRWLGVRADPALRCPDPGGSWVSTATFSTTSPKLAPYCTFTFIDARPVTAADLALLQQLVPGQLDELAADVMGLGSFGPAVPANLWQPLYAHFLKQAGHTELAEIAGYSPVRLAVLDTHPTADADPHHLPSNSPHGYTLLNMAHRALCEHRDPLVTDCVVQLTSQLALSYVSYDPDDPSASVQDLVMGGYVGTLVDLAQAIHAEVDAWEESALPSQNLVLNLSVGWNPQFGGLEADTYSMPVPVRAVYEAINDAACRGALVVAATGNRSGGPESGSGPMMPAAWAVRNAPSAAECGHLPVKHAVTARSSVRSPSPDVPLLYAVGGAQSGGEPLANSRPFSLPERVAFGDHGVVAGHADHGEPTAILTGSSVATLVASAAASAAWYYAPDSTGHKIMAVLDLAGDSLPMTADFCFDTAGGCSAVRRVAVCPGVMAICAQLLNGCPVVDCLPWDPAPPDLSDNLASLDPALEIDLTTIDQPYPDAPFCDPSTPHFDPANGPSADPCPDRQYVSVEATPWVHPQPGSHACPPCRVHENTQELIIEIDPALTGTLSQPTLDVCGSSYSLGSIALDPGATTVVQNVDTSGCSSPVVSFTVTENGTTSSSIDSALVVE